MIKGVLERRYGTIFNQLFSLRMTGDYEDRRFLDIGEKMWN